MKKLLLLISLLFIIAIPCIAYQTVIIKFPNGEFWKTIYYKKSYGEAILQYIPPSQSKQTWLQSVIIHSYNGYTYPAHIFMDQLTANMEVQNPTSTYKYIKYMPEDSLAVRCTKAYKKIKPQCEIFRVARAHDGIITIHYVNRDLNNFKHTYRDWHERISKAVFYYSHFRDERIMDKALYYEL